MGRPFDIGDANGTAPDVRGGRVHEQPRRRSSLYGRFRGISRDRRRDRVPRRAGSGDSTPASIPVGDINGDRIDDLGPAP
jgi:hypothetical protein